MNKVATGASFTVKFIPKGEFSVLDSFVIRNKNKNTETTLVKDTTVTYYDHDYYVEADVTYTVAEGEFFQFKVYNDLSELVYIGSIFCTDQTDYSIQNGEHTQHTTTNEYITR